MERTGRLRVTEYFRARLAEEARRSERYNRDFSVAFISCQETEARQIFNSLRPFLRCTDVVEVIRGLVGAASEGLRQERERVAFIMPETGRAESQAVMERLKADLSDLPDLRLGLAVFPEDAQNPQDLLALAARDAGETFETS
ncbi:MAG: hypothetical protein AMK73_01400 [Planctomycetes bacterium SM23_32]|nr:MAG: hypothetical protein AMK73_01400 [Planctomycetes bacterium SM23_32]